MIFFPGAQNYGWKMLKRHGIGVVLGFQTKAGPPGVFCAGLSGLVLKKITAVKLDAGLIGINTHMDICFR